MSIGGVTFPLEKQSKDPQSVVYTAQYDTEGVAHSKSGERQPVQINIQVKVKDLLCTGQRLVCRKIAFSSLNNDFVLYFHFFEWMFEWKVKPKIKMHIFLFPELIFNNLSFVI